MIPRLVRVLPAVCGLLLTFQVMAAPLFPRPADEIPGRPQDANGAAVADFDNDGHLDVVQAGWYYTNHPQEEYGGFLHVYLGQGDGQFTRLSTFDSDDAPWDVAAADFDADGNMDLVTANYENLAGISVYLGNGDGTFDLYAVYPDSYKYSVAIGDFNGDDIPDVLGSPGGMVLLGEGTGRFLSFPVPAGSYFSGVADFDRDGIDDYATPWGNDTVRVMRSLGNGQFVETDRPVVGDDPEVVTAGDVSGDGVPDLLVANTESGDLSVLLGNGDGTFGVEQRYDLPFSGWLTPWSMAIHDLDGDGLQDVVVSSNGGRLAILHGTGTGQFSVAEGSTSYIAFNYELGPGDFDEDGSLDVVQAGWNPARINWLLGDGEGGFVDGSQEDVGDAASDIAVDDLDADGRFDLVTANTDSDDVSVLLGEGALTFAMERRFCVEAAEPPCPDGSEPSALATGELTGDAHVDLAVANEASNRVSILAGNGSGGFSFLSDVPVFAGMAPSSLALGDLDSDDDEDLVVVGEGSSSLGVYLGDGAGGFGAPPGLPSILGAGPTAVALGDLDGDGSPDVVAANIGSSTVNVLLGDGDGTFTPAPIVPLGDPPSDLAVEDLNHDSILDLAIATYERFYIHLGIGDGTFGEATLLEPPGANNMRIMDVDGDGNQDLAGSRYSGITLVFRGNGDGTFGPVESFLGGSGRFVLQDLDLDSCPDWAQVGVMIMPNQSGARRFGFEADGVTLSWPAVPGAQSYDVYRGDLSDLADANGDGLPDTGYGACRTMRDDDPRDTYFVDMETPAQAGMGFFYLRSVIDLSGDGGLGTTSAGLPRVPAEPCP